ncbi:MAG: sarcosine oxidase subunit gamma [Methylophilaceae bacterium]
MIASTKKLVTAEADKNLLAIADVTHFKRFGVKGAKAAEWLSGQGVTLPESNNSCLELSSTSLAMRLGSSEFMIESQSTETLPTLSNSDQFSNPGVYKVQRADAAFIISGQQALNLLSELCTLNLGTLDLASETLSDNKLLMTQVAGISAILLKQSINGKDAYRIWCDGTYGPYMSETLLEIATELGGGAFEFNTQTF